jgi:hypothetical protein
MSIALVRVNCKLDAANPAAVVTPERSTAKKANSANSMKDLRAALDIPICYLMTLQVLILSA